MVAHAEISAKAGVSCFGNRRRWDRIISLCSVMSTPLLKTGPFNSHKDLFYGGIPMLGELFNSGDQGISTNGAQKPYCSITQRCQGLRYNRMPHSAFVLAQGNVAHPVQSVLYAPMSSRQSQQARRVGRERLVMPHTTSTLSLSPFWADMTPPVMMRPFTAMPLSNSAAAVISFSLFVATGTCPSTPDTHN